MKARLVTLALLCATASALLPVAPAGAAVTFEVEVGRFFDETDHTAESMRFYPDSIRVASGDTLHFSTESFHGVTLLPEGNEPAAWAAAHAAPGGPWSAFVADPDEGSRAARVNLAVAAPSRPCGWPGQSPCEFDGSGDAALGPLNSGLALFPTEDGTETRELGFSVTITADPGTTIHAVDPLHPEMSMTISVAGSLAERSDAAALAAQSEETFEADRERAAQLDRTYSRKRVKKTAKGKTTWQAWAGVEEEGISLRRFYPRKLTIRARDRVKWVFSKNVFEAHAVTFPRGAAGRLARSFPTIACDTNGDSSSEPDSAPASSAFPFCSSFGHLELDVPEALVTGGGNGVVKSSKDFETSGARGASWARSARAYQLSFPKKSSRKGFTYACAIHEAAHAPMRGTVVVKR